MAEEKTNVEVMAQKINEEITGIKEMINKSSTKEEADALKKEITDLKESFPGDEYNEKINNLEMEVRKATSKLSKVTLVGISGGVRLRDRIKEQLETDIWKKHLGNRADGESPIANIVTKDIDWGAAGANGTNDVVQNAMPFIVPQYPFEEPFDVRSVVPVGTVDTGSLDYPQELLYTDGMDVKGETGVSDETTITFQMVTENAHRIATFAEVSRRALRNTAWLSAYLANRFMEKFVKLLNTQVLVGDGTGENLNGIITQATVYATGTSITDTIPSGESTLIDCVLAQKTQLYDVANVMANAVFVSPTTQFQLTVQKTTTRDYANSTVLAQNTATGLWNLGGMTIIMSKDVPDGFSLVGMVSPTVLELLMNGGIDMATTQSHSTNFTASLVAFRFEADLLFPVYRPYAFNYGQLSAIQTDITSA